MLYVQYASNLLDQYLGVESCANQACKELVAFYDAYTNPEKGTVSIVLEYMDGGSLEVSEKTMISQSYHLVYELGVH